MKKVTIVSFIFLLLALIEKNLWGLACSPQLDSLQNQLLFQNFQKEKEKHQTHIQDFLRTSLPKEFPFKSSRCDEYGDPLPSKPLELLKFNMEECKIDCHALEKFYRRAFSFKDGRDVLCYSAEEESALWTCQAKVWDALKRFQPKEAQDFLQKYFIDTRCVIVSGYEWIPPSQGGVEGYGATSYGVVVPKDSHFLLGGLEKHDFFKDVWGVLKHVFGSTPLLLPEQRNLLKNFIFLYVHQASPEDEKWLDTMLQGSYEVPVARYMPHPDLWNSEKFGQKLILKLWAQHFLKDIKLKHKTLKLFDVSLVCAAQQVWQKKTSEKKDICFENKKNFLQDVECFFSEQDPHWQKMLLPEEYQKWQLLRQQFKDIAMVNKKDEYDAQIKGFMVSVKELLDVPLCRLKNMKAFPLKDMLDAFPYDDMIGMVTLFFAYIKWLNLEEKIADKDNLQEIYHKILERDWMGHKKFLMETLLRQWPVVTGDFGSFAPHSQLVTNVTQIPLFVFMRERIHQGGGPKNVEMISRVTGILLDLAKGDSQKSQQDFQSLRAELMTPYEQDIKEDTSLTRKASEIILAPRTLEEAKVLKAILDITPLDQWSSDSLDDDLKKIPLTSLGFSPSVSVEWNLADLKNFKMNRDERPGDVIGKYSSAGVLENGDKTKKLILKDCDVVFLEHVWSIVKYLQLYVALKSRYSNPLSFPSQLKATGMTDKDIDADCLAKYADLNPKDKKAILEKFYQWQCTLDKNLKEAPHNFLFHTSVPGHHQYTTVRASIKYRVESKKIDLFLQRLATCRIIVVLLDKLLSTNTPEDRELVFCYLFKFLQLHGLTNPRIQSIMEGLPFINLSQNQMKDVAELLKIQVGKMVNLFKHEGQDGLEELAKNLDEKNAEGYALQYKENLLSSLDLYVQMQDVLSRIIEKPYERKGDGVADIKISMLDDKDLFGKNLKDIPHSPLIYGGKGAKLMDMVALGIPVPKGVVIPQLLVANIKKDDIKNIAMTMEKQTGKDFFKMDGVRAAQTQEETMPLLVSVRSGSFLSMPGALETLLNIGMTRAVAEKIEKITTNTWFAYDLYRTFLFSWLKLIEKCPVEKMNEVENSCLKKDRKADIFHMNGEEMKALTQEMEKLLKNPLPNSIEEQLWQACKAVEDSWESPICKSYLLAEGRSFDWKTSIVIQEMVYGNWSSIDQDHLSGTGVCFTKSFNDDVPELVISFKENAQGEAVVGGDADQGVVRDGEWLKRNYPSLYEDLSRYAGMVQTFFSSHQDLEFTVEKGKLYLLQTREMKENVKKFPYIIGAVDQNRLLGQGYGIYGGAVSGRLAFSLEDIQSLKKQYPEEKIIYVTDIVSPEKYDEVRLADAVLAQRGNKGMHALAVAMDYGISIVSCDDMSVGRDVLTIKDQNYQKGSVMTVDGRKGAIYQGSLETQVLSSDRDLVGLLVDFDPAVKVEDFSEHQQQQNYAA